MPRPKKDYKLLNIRLASDVSNLMDKFCEENGVSKTVATEKILRQYFNQYFKQSANGRKLFKDYRAL